MSWDIIEGGGGGGGTSTPARMETLLYSESIMPAQNPSGLGPSNAIAINFGPDPIALDDVGLEVDGWVKFRNVNPYVLTVGVQFGRAGGNSGESEILFRMVDDMGNQVGKSVNYLIDDVKTNQYLEVTRFITPEAMTSIKFEIMRDSNGNDSGGLIRYRATGDPNMWAQAPTASITIQKFV